MSLKHGLLGLLNYGQMTGYELDKAFKASLRFFWQAQTSQIYRELNAMEQSGWLTSEIIYQTDKPNKKRYAITELGKLELQNWLAQNSLESEFQIRNLFLMKLFFSGGKDLKENIAMLNDYKKRCIDELVKLDTTGNSIEQYRKNISTHQDAIYWEFTARFGELYYKMYLEFLEEAIEKLEELQ